MHSSGLFDLITRILSESLALTPSVEKMTIQQPLPFDRSMWAPQVAEFTGSGWRVIAPDLRGYGESSMTPGTVGWSTFASRLADRSTSGVGNSGVSSKIS